IIAFPEARWGRDPNPDASGPRGSAPATRIRSPARHAPLGSPVRTTVLRKGVPSSIVGYDFPSTYIGRRCNGAGRFGLEPFLPVVSRSTPVHPNQLRKV